MNHIEKIVVVLAVCLIVLYVYSYFWTPTEDSGIFGTNALGGLTRWFQTGNIETFDELKGAPLGHKMGEYSDIYLDSAGQAELEKIYFGDGNKAQLLVPEEACDSNSCFNKVSPNVDGTSSTPRSMSMFKYNKSDPKCCPGPYSTSTGCVCRTDEQVQWIRRRGNNS